MMDDITALQAEVERLRELLIENGINPEPYVAPPPQFGPPTQFERAMQKMTAKLFARAVAESRKPNAFLEDRNFAADGELIGREIHIRLPTDYTVTP